MRKSAINWIVKQLTKLKETGDCALQYIVFDSICICGCRDTVEDREAIEIASNPEEAVELLLNLGKDRYETVTIERGNHGYYNLIVTEKLNYECCDCRHTHEVKANKPVGFDNEVWSHGLATPYGKRKSAEEIKRSFLQILKSSKGETPWEICCSDETQQIGAIGIAVSGNVTIASNYDLYSTINDRGERIFADGWRAQYVIHSITEKDLLIHDHIELFVRPRKVQYIWVKKWAIKQSGIPELVEWFKNHGYEVREVAERFQ